MSCESCYEYEYNDCSALLLDVSLTPATAYYIFIKDKHGDVRSYQETSDGNGDLTIDTTNFPDTFFNKYNSYEVWVSTSSDGQTRSSFTISGTAYTCYLITLTVNCCPS